MATGKKRTLKAEKHPDPDPVADTVDAEVRDVGAARQRRTKRGDDSPRAQRMRYDRARASERQRTRRDAAGRDGDPTARLKLGTQRAQDQFIHHLRTSGITSPGASRSTQGEKVSDLHQAYASMLVLQCLEPLRGGLSAQNVLTTVGMGTAMWLLSPNFRTQVGEYAGQMATVIGDRLDGQARREERIAAKGERSRAKEARYFDRTGQGREGMRGPSGWVHRRRLERVERMERGDRDLFTEHSAALTHVGIAQNAYDEMRRPGADRELVKQNYESALRALYGCVDQDGVDRGEVARDMRGIVGRLIERDPEQAAVFSELGHGRFVRSEPETVVGEGTTKARTGWTGDYVDAHNGDVITGGTFSVREPMGADEHRAEVARTMYAELSSTRNPAEFKAVMEQYVVGSRTMDQPEVVDRTEDPSARARLNRARTMFASMRGDGVSERDQKLVYVGGFVESLRAMERTHPQKVAQWQQSLGPEWEQRMRDLISENSAFGGQNDRARTDRGQRGPRGLGEPEQGPERGRDEAEVTDARTGPGSATEQRWEGVVHPTASSGNRPPSGVVARRFGAFADQKANDMPSPVRPAIRMTRAAPEQDKGHELGG